MMASTRRERRPVLAEGPALLPANDAAVGETETGPPLLEPARERAGRPEEKALVLVDGPSEVVALRRMADLPDLLAPGDLVVFNDAATLPASLPGWTATGAPVEVRLAGYPLDDAKEIWRGIVFGEGDWRTPTERRPPPPPLRPGDRLFFGRAPGAALLGGTVAAVDEPSGRLIDLVFDRRGAPFWERLYRVGRPVQYSYLPRPLALWDVETPFASRPWAAEAPSASFALTFALVARLRARGVGLATITHAAGLSSTGDEALDGRLPLPERFEVLKDAVDAVLAARGRGGRVVAVGTTVVRALESAAEHEDGRLRPAAGTTALRLGPSRPLRVVDALLTGLHEEGTSHAALLATFVPSALWRRAYAFAKAKGLRGHELGDVALVRRR
jgi:S-adenosylmethionine:tRNA ribosyltransferase-isomerase